MSRLRGLAVDANTTLHGGGPLGHNGPPQAKSAPVHQVTDFEGPQLVDNFYLPLYLIVLFVLRPKMT